MDYEHLKEITRTLLAPGKGLLAIDESTESCNKRFAAVGVEETEPARREYRELLITAPGIESYVSGYIMYDETIRQSTGDGKRFPDVLQDKGILVGIKVDQGLEEVGNGEKITKGLEGLSDRLVEYRAAYGARFTKWRSVVVIGEGLPTDEVARENATRLASYAKTVQENSMVPIIEPEVLLDGTHSLDQCYEVTARNLDAVFAAMREAEVYLPGLILKTSMVMPGASAIETADVDAVAHATIKCLREHVPAEIGGIVFLSGGQSSKLATDHLNRMHGLYPELPWPLTFSYSRAIQNDTLHAWANNRTDIATAQQLLVAWARRNSLASIGQYNSETDRVPA